MNRPDPVFGNALVHPQRWNGYSYVVNNPLGFIDPTGMDSDSIPVFKASGVGYTCALTNCVTLPEQPPDAALEGLMDLLAGDAGKSHYESLSGVSWAYFGGAAGKTQPPPAPRPAQKKKPPADNRACPPVPQGPPGVNVDGNVTIARRMRIVTYINPAVSLYAYSQMVGNQHPWDYKQLGSDFQAFGNFNFGAAGAAWGIPLNVLQRGAGYAQSKAATSTPEWGHWYKGPPYGDDPSDQAQVVAGYLYYQYGCYEKQ
jgi:hypothetical protein